MSDNERGTGGDEVGLPRATVNKLISGESNLSFFVFLVIFDSNLVFTILFARIFIQRFCRRM
jgi:hypothetical protein